MIPDFHVHTKWSSDSDTPPKEQIEAAIRCGMKQLCITEHQDYDSPVFPPDYFNFLIADKGDDDSIKAYIENMTALKEEYADRIELLIGIELGLQPHLGERLQKIRDDYAFDFIIGSTHAFGGMDAEDKRHYENIDIETAVRRYFEEELVNIRAFRGFDVAGHMDFVLRYGPGAAETFSYEKYGDVLDAILLELIHTGRGIECNTSKYKLKNMTNPHMSIIKRYAELGGTILTFGSDSHVSSRIGEGFREVSKMVEACGIRYYTVFRKHEPFFYKIDK